MQSVFSKERLTQELYNNLVEKGYKYILIWDVHEERGLRNYVLIPTYEICSIPGCNCVSISHETIRTIVNDQPDDISAMVKIARSIDGVDN